MYAIRSYYAGEFLISQHENLDGLLDELCRMAPAELLIDDSEDEILHMSYLLFEIYLSTNPSLVLNFYPFLVAFVIRNNFV